MPRLRLVSVVCLLAVSACGGGAAHDEGGGFVPVTDAMLQDPPAGHWLMWRRTLDAWGYSPLDEVTRRNVSQLRMVWTRGMGPGIQEATPLVYDGVMYLPNPGDHIQAIAATTGDLVWEYRRTLPDDLGEYLPAFEITRNLAIYGDTILHSSADGYLIGLDVHTGELLWETQVLDYRAGAQQSSGPIVAGGRVFSGRGCEPEGGPAACIVTAHDAQNGEELWRTRTIPAPGETGDDTWGGVPFEKRLHVGTWMVPSYDPALNLLIVGTSVTSPAPKFLLGGNDQPHLYHNSTLALDADTGRIVWHYQHLIDHWDLDHPFERLLIDTAVAPARGEVTWINPRVTPGERRRVVTGIPGKTGIVYTLDRETGEFLWARPTIRQNVVSGIDGATGRATVNSDTVFTAAGQSRLVCPSTSGGKNWPAGAYSPLTHTMYFPLQNTCMTATAVTGGDSFEESLYAISTQAGLPDGIDDAGSIYAVSVETGRTMWRRDQRAGVLSLMATGGGLVFGGDMSGRFRALDDTTGDVLWEISLGAPVSGYPIAFSAQGRQYVAVSTGPSLLGSGVLALTPEIEVGTGANLFVFALPE